MFNMKNYSFHLDIFPVCNFVPDVFYYINFTLTSLIIINICDKDYVLIAHKKFRITWYCTIIIGPTNLLVILIPTVKMLNVTANCSSFKEKC